MTVCELFPGFESAFDSEAVAVFWMVTGFCFVPLAFTVTVTAMTAPFRSENDSGATDPTGQVTVLPLFVQVILLVVRLVEHFCLPFTVVQVVTIATFVPDAL